MPETKVQLQICSAEFALNSLFAGVDSIFMHDHARMHGNQLLKPTISQYAPAYKLH